MIQSTHDILLVVIAFVVFLIGVLTAFAIYYVIILLKQAADIARDFHRGVDKVSDIADLVKEKLMTPSAWAAGVIAAVLKGMKMVEKSRKKKRDEE